MLITTQKTSIVYIRFMLIDDILTSILRYQSAFLKFFEKNFQKDLQIPEIVHKFASSKQNNGHGL